MIKPQEVRSTRYLAALEGKRFGLDKFLTILCFLILFVAVLLPVIMIVYVTFFHEGRFDVSLFTEVILDPGNVTAMWNTIKVAVGATVFGTLMGLFFAWLLGRSDIPTKGIMRALFTIPYMFPPFFGAMAWDLMLNSRSGYINRWLISTLGLAKAPININSIGGIIFVECCYYFPFVYMQVVNALERMDPTLEESARIAGAGQWYVIRKVTMPLVMPAISAGALLILTSSLAHFGVPSMLGFSRNIYTLPTKIFQLFHSALGSFQGIREGSALSVLLILVVVFALWLQRYILREGSYDIIKGKSTRPMLVKLRGARIPLTIFCYVSLFVIVLMPLVMITLVGLLKAYGLPMTVANMTLDNFKEVLFGNTMVRHSIQNSIILSFSAGIVCMFMGVLVAYVVVKIRPKGSILLELLSLLPYAIPGIVMAIGVILTWSGRFGINLYNSIWIILIAYLARYLSFSMKSASASLQQVHPSLEEAARSCGASHSETLKDVTLQLIRPAMVAGFFLIFLPAMRELTTSILLYGPYTRTLGVAIYSLRSDGYITTASALATVAIVLIIILNNVVDYFLKDRGKTEL
jgi:iron(III) transport system permease protein